MRPVALSGCILVVVFVVAGCGGGDSTTASVTKAQFVKEANAICKEGEERIQDDFSAYINEHANDNVNPTEETFAEVVGTVLTPNLEQEAEEIRALGAPSGDEDQVEAILNAMEEGRESAEDDPKAAVQGGNPGLDKAHELAKEYGLEACGG